MALGGAILYALFVWWIATGLVLLLVLRTDRRTSLGVAAACTIAAFALIVWSPLSGTVAGALIGFSAAVVLWGAQEIAFLTGAVTGPRPVACPTGAKGATRFLAALGAILYHELALTVGLIAVSLAGKGAIERTALLTYLVLWGMRLSAKLNLFLGVPVLHDQALPRPLHFLRSYFRRGPATIFFPISLAVAVFTLTGLVGAAASPDLGPGTRAGLVLVASLLTLGIVEHLFMLLPLPIDRLWAWSGAGPTRETDAPRDRAPGELERVLPTAPL